MQGFLGTDGFVWWHGVVEDVDDPLRLGRCRVRVFGFHSDKKGELPTGALPWAYPMQPITSAALSGIGTSPTGLLTGSHVFGFFRDGMEAQDPVIIGSFGGIPQEKLAQSEGFADPKGRYPINEGYLKNSEKVSGQMYPIGVSVVGERDTNRLAANTDSNGVTNFNTVVDLKKDTAVVEVKNVPEIGGGFSWKEPITPYAAKYPKNHVRFTESGHVEEFDDTPGKERIHVYHNSGSFVEVGNGWENNPDGTRVQRIIGDDYEIIHGNKRINIRGKSGVEVVVDGSMNLTVGAGANIQINGTANVLAKKDLNLRVEGSLNASAKKMGFYSDGDIGFSGNTISFSTQGSTLVLRRQKRIEANSGSAVLKPNEVNLSSASVSASTGVGLPVSSNSAGLSVGAFGALSGARNLVLDSMRRLFGL